MLPGWNGWQAFTFIFVGRQCKRVEGYLIREEVVVGRTLIRVFFVILYRHTAGGRTCYEKV